MSYEWTLNLWCNLWRTVLVSGIDQYFLSPILPGTMHPNQIDNQDPLAPDTCLRVAGCSFRHCESWIRVSDRKQRPEKRSWWRFAFNFYLTFSLHPHAFIVHPLGVFLISLNKFYQCQSFVCVIVLLLLPAVNQFVSIHGHCPALHSRLCISELPTDRGSIAALCLPPGSHRLISISWKKTPSKTFNLCP